jgi:hypothetical protein
MGLAVGHGSVTVISGIMKLPLSNSGSSNHGSIIIKCDVKEYHYRN